MIIDVGGGIMQVQFQLGPRDFHINHYKVQLWRCSNDRCNNIVFDFDCVMTVDIYKNMSVCYFITILNVYSWPML